jgi:hypothetical protein
LGNTIRHIIYANGYLGFIGRELPLLAAPTPSAHALDPDGPKASLDRSHVTFAQTAELGTAVRTMGRRLIGFLLRNFLSDSSLHVAGSTRNLFLNMPQVLVRGLDHPV